MIHRFGYLIGIYRAYFNEHGIALTVIQEYLKFEFDPNWYQPDVITTYYCTKIVQGATGYQWPAGHYCIARYGGSCPDGFLEGSITWDDEDSNNKNSRHPLIQMVTMDQPTPRFISVVVVMVTLTTKYISPQHSRLLCTDMVENVKVSKE